MWYLALVKRPLRRWLVEPSPDQSFVVSARDGLRLSVHRIKPSAQAEARGAVLLQHGLASGSLGLQYPGRSLAHYLAERGYDCYLPELRGHGASEAPRDMRWDLDDYLFNDIPAVLDAVLERSGRERVHWIGHSMGGVLLFLLGILRPDAPIASGQAIGSALDYRVGSTGFSRMLPLRPLLDYVPALPYGAVMHLAAPLLARLPDPVSGFNFWHSNVEPSVIRRISGSLFHTISPALLRSLSATFEPRGFSTRDGSVSFLERARSFTLPLRLIAGTRDKQVSVEAVRHTATLVGGRAEVKVHGKEHGDADDYGHWDLILGKRAPSEVWPGVLAWLDEHSAEGRSPQGR